MEEAHENLKVTKESMGSSESQTNEEKGGEGDSKEVRERSGPWFNGKKKREILPFKGGSRGSINGPDKGSEKNGCG